VSLEQPCAKAERRPHSSPQLNQFSATKKSKRQKRFFPVQKRPKNWSLRRNFKTFNNNYLKLLVSLEQPCAKAKRRPHSSPQLNQFSFQKKREKRRNSVKMTTTMKKANYKP
jgi:hypothetical protein